MTQLLAHSTLPWRDVQVVASTGSTNSDLLARLARGAAREGSVIAAGEQVAGRGRRGRVWASPPGTTLSFSVALTPPVSRGGFVPVLTAVAVARAIADTVGVTTSLKWPNDIMVNGGKVAGILAEGGSGAVVVGCGINVTVRQADLPVAGATSLSHHAAAVDRTELLVAALDALHGTYARWADAGFSAAACGLLDTYRATCATIGSRVRVSLPDGGELTGNAIAIDDDGRLVVSAAGETRTLTAGDVTHLRPAP